MKKKVLHAAAHSALAFAAVLVFTCVRASAQQVASNAPSATERTAAGAPAFKRMAISVGQSAQGSRVRVISDSPLNGYEAFARDGKFCVLIHGADASALAGRGFAARGFTSVEAEQQGDDTLLAFATEPNFEPHVRAVFNQLEIVFAAQTQTASGGSSPAGGTPTSTGNSSKETAGATPTPTPSTAAPAAQPVPASITTTDAGATPSAATTSGATPGAGATTAPPTASNIFASLPASAEARYALLRTAEKVNPVKLTRFDKPPVIDGKMDEDVWKTATVFKDFVQFRPGELQAPSLQTEVRIGYDAKFLYVGFHCFDDPSKVRATVPKRDNVFDDDWVGVWLDTFNDGRRAYELIFNPLGVQADAIDTEGVNEDFSFDIVMESKGSITKDGYDVEVAIPFKSLRYVAGKDKLWGLHLLRTIKRFNNEQDSWMPIARSNSSLLGQEGHVTGLEGLSTERTIEVTPSLTVSETGARVPTLTAGDIAALQAQNRAVPLDNGRFLNKPLHFDPGITAKFGLSPTMTLDFTYNPDFAQVEADQTVVTANQRFPIFFDEKRPFFLEGKDYFETIISAVHTRTIVNPQYAFKFTGKEGKNTFGVLLASDKAPGNLTDQERDFIADARNPEADREALAKIDGRKATIGVVRLKRDFGKESHIGFLATTYNFVDHYNDVAGFDTRYRLNKTTVFTAQVLGSTTHEPFFFADEDATGDRKEQGLAYAYDLNMSGRNFGYEYAAVGRSQFFRADVGFNRRFNTNNQNLFARYNSTDKPKAKLVSWRVYNDLDANFDWKARSQHLNNETQVQFNFHKQTTIGIGFDKGYERVFESDFGASREGFARADAANALLRGKSVPACLTFTNDPTLDSSVQAQLPQCTFYGTDPERSAWNWGWYFFAQTTPSKKYSAFVFSDFARGSLDFDFGTGNPHFPRVSPAALRLGQGAPLDPGPGREWRAEVDLTYKPTNPLNFTLNYNKDRLTRDDTGLTAFDDNIFSLHTTYQFTRFWFVRGRVDYSTLGADVRGQFLLGWTPNPGTSFYVGYNDDLNRNGVNPFTGQIEPGFRRNGRVFFIKASYLIRRSIGK
ncbi:MAG TPA: DUF5916 domain-containing protein [Pyrinomonadaceae bacterium]|nr:DUF5916 domain-containing protein [Pyrinomonadaceae bacterium]